MAANFTSGVGPFMRIIEPFKQVLRVTAHPQILTLELRAPMGACSGQYGSTHALSENQRQFVLLIQGKVVFHIP